jgi:hypothetical protein
MVRVSKDTLSLGTLFLPPICKAIFSKIEGCRAPGYDRAVAVILRFCEASGIRQSSKHFRSRSCRRTQRHNGKGARKFQEGRSGGVGSPRSIQAKNNNKGPWAYDRGIRSHGQGFSSTSDQPISQGTSISTKGFISLERAPMCSS